MKRPTCKTCPYWDTQWDDEIQKGHLDEEYAPDTDTPARDCRRWPPLRSMVDSYLGSGRDDQIDWLLQRGWGGHGKWLQTAEDDWCGEHPDFPEWLAAQEANQNASTSTQ